MGETKTYKFKVEESSFKSKEKKNKSPKIIKWIIKMLVALFTISTAIATIVVALLSYKALDRNNKIIDTANLLYINNDIQTKLDTFRPINDEITVLLKEPKEQNTEESQTLTSLIKKREDVIYSFLNTFEFACVQYDNDKIDKDSFKLFYDGEYFKSVLLNFMLLTKKSNYPYMEKVCGEWGWDIFSTLRSILQQTAEKEQ
jgi:hypothetical protein